MEEKKEKQKEETPTPAVGPIPETPDRVPEPSTPTLPMPHPETVPDMPS
jgi:hypothetical protein